MKLSVSEAYQTLGLEDGSSLELVKSAYKKVALRTHPDKCPESEKEQATAQFQKVSEAYNALLKHLDTSTPRPPRFPGFRYGADSDEDYDDYDDYDEYDEYSDYDDEEEKIHFYMYLFEELMRGRANRYMNMRFRREPRETETPEQYQARLRRSREEQIAAEERRKREAAERKAQLEIEREMERAAAEERQKAKVEAKKAQAKMHRSKAETAARKLQQQVQTKRSAIFAAARAGKQDEVKKGVWEDDVDAAGGEVKAGCDAFVKMAPKDPQETLLHIAARNGDKELVKWLDAHSADLEERDSRGLTAFHVALQCGHVPIVAYFLEEHPLEDSNGVYKPPASKSLLSLALESHEPELVWKILDNDLATEQEINQSWAWITSAEGRSAMKKNFAQNGGRKGKAHGDEKFQDIMKLLMRFGGFTPPPTPSSSDYSDREEQWHENVEASHTHTQTQTPAQQQGATTRAYPPPEDPRLSQQKQPHHMAGSGRRGKGGRGRGKKSKS
ncbi:hypothetical protein MSAN_01018700 [Mycena sanguinolenta]|uniref:J domain-containing protein n=1 Tax=Mycena sanguinolenta TaxID=230812 RepID=A0A8H6YRR5_9AGAR|nr:hypothetical protein MSAN_01018700 [Mycena sanguinolenta]